MKKTLAIAALALLVAGAAQAQVNASITATAVVAGPLGIAAGNNLNFGTVIPGTARVIDPLTSTSAGSFTLTGGANAQLNLSWTVPTDLVDGAGHTLGVTFAATYGTTATQSAATALTLPDLTRRLSAAGDAYIWVGGTATPLVGQFVATYTGTVQVTAAYTGN
jgi:hypothetical protein